MSTSCGQDEPYKSPKNTYFNCAIDVYFMSFFYEHPLVMKEAILKKSEYHQNVNYANVIKQSFCGAKNIVSFYITTGCPKMKDKQKMAIKH